jgi:hypothetical protein
VRNPPGAKNKYWLCHPTGSGGWEKGAKGIDTTILYRADEVAEAIKTGREICCVEGEKDADNLWRLDIPATCNAHGAHDPALNQKPKWYVAHSEQLRDADLVVLNDNDPPGYAHCDVTCRLSLDFAKRVRRLDLKDHWPEIPKGGDVSDWASVGGEHTPERLKELIAAAPDYVPAAAASDDKSANAADDDAELEKLARMAPFDYERARMAAAKALGVRAPMLDKLVALKRSELGLDGDGRGQGRAIELPEPTPWETPVNGAELLDAVAAVVRRHVVLPDYACDAIALWTAHTFLLDRLMITPRLAITSPTKGCGKTTLLDVVSQLVFRPLAAANCSASSIFRVVEGFRPCLLIDEADSFLSGNEELRGILNSGHRRGGAVLRNVGDDHEPHSFSTFSACAIALIGRLPGTLADRAVPIDLVRRKADEAIEPFRFDRVDHLAVLARKLMRWTEDNADAVAATEPEMPAGLYNRAADNWRGLLAIATVAGGDWLARGHKAALQGAGADVDEGSRLELLLGDVRDILDEHGLERIASDTLIERLVEITPRPWAEYGRSGKPITQNKLARLLKPLGIAPVQIRVEGEKARGYERHQFEDAFARYLASEGVSNRYSGTNADNMGTSGTSSTGTAGKSVPDEKCKKSNNDGLCTGVPVGKGVPEEKGLSTREIDAQAELYADDFYRRRDEPDIEAELNQELRQRLRNGLGVLPEHVETEFRRVIEAVFRISDARTRQSF